MATVKLTEEKVALIRELKAEVGRITRLEKQVAQLKGLENKMAQMSRMQEDMESEARTVKQKIAELEVRATNIDSGHEALKAIADPLHEAIKTLQDSNIQPVHELVDSIKQPVVLEERPQWKISLLWFLNKVWDWCSLFLADLVAGYIIVMRFTVKTDGDVLHCA